MDWCGWIPRGWIEWGAASQVLFLMLAAGALIYAQQQAKDASRARKLTAIRVLFDEIGTDEIRSLRTWVLEEAGAPFPLTIAARQKADIRRLAIAYDRVAYMIK